MQFYLTQYLTVLYKSLLLGTNTQLSLQLLQGYHGNILWISFRPVSLTREHCVKGLYEGGFFFFCSRTAFGNFIAQSA